MAKRKPYTMTENEEASWAEIGTRHLLLPKEKQDSFHQILREWAREFGLDRGWKKHHNYLKQKLAELERSI